MRIPRGRWRPPQRIDDNTYRLWGDSSVRLWADRFGLGEIDPHVHTVAGLILAKLGRLPREGDRVHIRNLTLTVERMDHRRIERVIVERCGTGLASQLAGPAGHLIPARREQACPTSHKTSPVFRATNRRHAFIITLVSTIGYDYLGIAPTNLFPDCQLLRVARYSLMRVHMRRRLIGEVVR